MTLRALIVDDQPAVGLYLRTIFADIEIEYLEKSCIMSFII